MKSFLEADINPNIAIDIVRYARFILERGFVCNTLGNIAIRDRTVGGVDVVYTKPMGISLEEFEARDISITDLLTGRHLHGRALPSIGNIANRAILINRPDVNAVIHLHIDEVIGYYAAYRNEKTFFYLSIDAPVVLQKPVVILNADSNIEKDASLIPTIINNTNCIVMPSHGVTTLGATISEAYHRMTTFVAELRRIILAKSLCGPSAACLPTIPNDEIEIMYRDGHKIIYGETQ